MSLLLPIPFILLIIIFLFGCSEQDPAKWIARNCPVKYVEGDEFARIVRDRVYFDESHCYVSDNCWRNANAICRWAKAQGIPCKTLPSAVKVGDKIITGGTVYVQPERSNYYLKFQYGVGIVTYRIEK